MKLNKLRIGSRGSKLALWQAHFFKSELELQGIDSEVVIIKTQGDQIQNLGFDKLEGKGFFTKEIEDALLAHKIDIAVHSMKDLPTDHPKGLVIGGISDRANPQDLLIIKTSSFDPASILKIKEGGTIGTSSIRRKVLLKSFQKDLRFKDIRGNVPTRLKKLNDQDDLNAIVLAAAGVERLAIDLSNYKVLKLNPKEFPCAPAQGVLAYQCREEDLENRRLLKIMNNDTLLPCINTERKILKLMEGGCQLPLGAYCEKDSSGNYHCYVAYSANGKDKLRFEKLSQSTTSNLAERMVKNLKDD